MDAAGGADVLVHNAGVMAFFKIVDGYPLEEQIREIDIDTVAPIRMIQHFLPSMLERDATIINVSSGLAYVPFAEAPVYSAAKAFVHAYTQCLREEAMTCPRVTCALSHLGTRAGEVRAGPCRRMTSQDKRPPHRTDRVQPPVYCHGTPQPLAPTWPFRLRAHSELPYSDDVSSRLLCRSEAGTSRAHGCSTYMDSRTACSATRTSKPFRSALQAV